jgi:hypothetical protein
MPFYFLKTIPALQFSASESKETDAVVAVSFPPHSYRVETGEITGLGVIRPGISGRFGFLETTISLQKGCSGSPLLNCNGDVIGINTRYSSLTSQSYAIDGQLAQRLIRSMLENEGRVKRSFWGLELVQKTRNIAGPYYPADPLGGILISGLLAESPACVVLKGYVGYFLTEINGIQVRNLPEVLALAERIQPGELVSLGLTRTDNAEEPVTRHSFVSEDLTVANLERIASYFLSRHACLQVEGNGPGLRLSGSFKGENVRVLTLWGNGPDIRQRNNPTVEAVSSGYGENFVGNRQFRIRNLKDLGILIRLSSLEGEVILDVLADGNMERVYFSFSPDKEKNTKKAVFRTLYY